MFDVVEVRWPSEPFIWRRARICDLTNEGVVCFFDDGSLNEIVFPFQDVRFLSEDADPSFRPETGDLVEYELLPSETSSGGWAVAKVASHSECLWHLRWPERSELTGEVLMPLSRLRPSVSRSVEGLQREEVSVEGKLLSNDAPSCFRRVESLAVGLQDGRETPELLRIRQVGCEAKVLVVGTGKAVQRAKLLIPSMLHHQRKAKVLEEATKKRDDALTARSMKKIRESWNRSDPSSLPHGVVKEEFLLEAVHVGRFVGKGGGNIRSLQNQLNVHISILDEDAERKKVLVLGSAAAVKWVRQSSEILQVVVSLDRETKKWCMWRSHVLDAIKRMCGLISMQLESDSVVLTGNTEACEQGKKFLEAQIQYFQRLQALETSKGDLKKELDEGPELVWPLQFQRVQVQPPPQATPKPAQRAQPPRAQPQRAASQRSSSQPKTPKPPRTQKVWF